MRSPASAGLGVSSGQCVLPPWAGRHECDEWRIPKSQSPSRQIMLTLSLCFTGCILYSQRRGGYRSWKRRLHSAKARAKLGLPHMQGSLGSPRAPAPREELWGGRDRFLSQGPEKMAGGEGSGTGCWHHFPGRYLRLECFSLHCSSVCCAPAWPSRTGPGTLLLGDATQGLGTEDARSALGSEGSNQRSKRATSLFKQNGDPSSLCSYDACHVG